MYIYDNNSISSVRMRNISDKNFRECRNTEFMTNRVFFPQIVPFMK